MREFPPGWETDLAVLRHSGSLITDNGDHLVIRTLDNPSYHWGNCIFVTDEGTVNDAQRWVETFRGVFSDAHWVSIGLLRMPNDIGFWEVEGLEVELDDVLTTRNLPRQTPLSQGYTVRRLQGSDWALSVERAVDENAQTGEEDPETFARFALARMESQRALSDRDVAAFFGAFDGDELVASLGIVRCGMTARYQSVVTDEAHRRRGLASHLLGIAARWSADHGCDRWVIITEATNPAGRVYRAVGFEPDIGNAQAYRAK